MIDLETHTLRLLSSPELLEESERLCGGCERERVCESVSDSESEDSKAKLRFWKPGALLVGTDIRNGRAGVDLSNWGLEEEDVDEFPDLEHRGSN